VSAAPAPPDGEAPIYTASCLCGGVQIALRAELGPIDLCYCSMCRKAHGGPLASNAEIASRAVQVRAGRELLRAYASSAGEERIFCARCGSPLYSRRDAAPQVVRIRVGIINEPLNVRPGAHYHVGSMCNWWSINDELPRFETQ
jgi:hypothetical protein